MSAPKTRLTTEPFYFRTYSNFFKFYKIENKKIGKKRKFDNLQEIKEVSDIIFKLISEKITENDGGVIIDNFGYFGIWRTPIKKIYRNVMQGFENEYFINPHTDNHLYLPIFIPKRNISEWSMDKTFTNSITTEMSKKLKAGKKYTFHKSLFDNLFNK